MRVKIGLESLIDTKKLQSEIVGDFGYLCHSASINHHFQLGVVPLQKIFKSRFKKIFGPQHGFVTDVQDNMVETKDFIHPYFNLPIHSLYSTTRIPTDEMLEGINTMVVDLQDVGTRVYTYIWTLALLMQKCAEKNIKVVILDRPNPIGGEQIEGNILDPNFKSFVGLHAIPMRHAMTMGEVGQYLKLHHNLNCELSVIPMKGWKRSQYFADTHFPWVNPSPNLPTIEGALTFVGTVLFEGANVSEGRGTTRSLEIIGHPAIEPFSFGDKLMKKASEEKLAGFTLRPIAFMPTFQKHAGKSCGGFHIHVTNKNAFNSWELGQFLMRECYHHLGDQFAWKEPPYEYEFDKMPIDLINGTNLVREWIVANRPMSELRDLANVGLEEYQKKRAEILIY